MKKTKKAIISKEGNKLVIEPVDDLLSLAGVFKSQKKISFKKIRRDFEYYLASEAVKSLR